MTTKELDNYIYDEFAPVSSMLSMLLKYRRENRTSLLAASIAAKQGGYDEELVDDSLALARECVTERVKL